MSSPRWPLGPVCGYFLLVSLRRATLCILLLTGLCLCLHQYHFINQSKSFYDAQTYCKTYFTDMATIDNMADMQQLVAAFDSGYEGSAWIGIYDIDWAWDWSMLDPRYYTLGSSEYLFRMWNVGEPNQPRNQTLCVGILGGYWFDFFCTETFTFVCYINPTGDPTLQANSTANYIYINQSMVWADAQSYCKHHYLDMASVRNTTENMLITEVVPDNLTVWIGLYKISWRWWSDSSVSPFRYWISGRPLATSGDCVSSVMNATVSGQWLENPCIDIMNLICYSTKKQVFVVKVTAVNPSVDMNDPNVLEDVLTFMEAKFSAMGVMQFVRLSWKTRPGKNIFHTEGNNNVGIMNQCPFNNY